MTQSSINTDGRPILQPNFCQAMIFALLVVFCFLSSSKAVSRDPHAVVKEAFQWSHFERSPCDELFCNAHRTDKNIFCHLLNEIAPSLKSKLCVSLLV